MPIFEYTCDDCGTRFEKLVRRSTAQDEVRECPSCGEHHLTQQYSTFSAHANASKSAAPAGGCGAGMCGNGFCGSGACEMN